MDDVLGALKTALHETPLRDTLFKVNPPAPQSARIRLDLTQSNLSAAKKAIESFSFHGVKPVVSQPTSLHRPALFVRNIAKVSPKGFLALFADDAAVERVQWKQPSPDCMNDLAVVYYASEDEAFAAVKRLKGVALDGKTLHVVYRCEYCITRADQ